MTSPASPQEEKPGHPVLVRVPGPPPPRAVFHRCSAADSALPLPPPRRPTPSGPKAETASETTVWAPCQRLPPLRPPSHCPGFLKLTLSRGKALQPSGGRMCVRACVRVCLPGAGLPPEAGIFSRMREAPFSGESTPLQLITESRGVTSCCRGHGWVGVWTVGDGGSRGFSGQSSPCSRC